MPSNNLCNLKISIDNIPSEILKAKLSTEYELSGEANLVTKKSQYRLECLKICKMQLKTENYTKKALKNKQLIKFFCTILIGIIGSGAIKAQESPKWIKELAIPLDSNLIESKRINQFLKSENQIMMGEPTHGDGNIMSYKIKLIKNLHENFGFNVILFEGDMLGFMASNKNAKEGNRTRTIINDVLPPMWKNSKELNELVEYVEKENSNGDSIFIAGFDTQFDTKSSINSFVSDFPKFLSSNNIAFSTEIGETGEDEKQNLISTFTALVYRGFRKGKPINTVDFSRFEHTIQRLKDSLEHFTTNDGRFWAQVLTNLKDYLPEMYANNNLPYKYITTEMNLRDSIMANNYIYQAEHSFKGKKLIAWAATDHIRRSMPNESSKKMGEFLSEKLKEKSPYIIGFTSGDGMYYNYIDKNTYPIPDLKPNSFEDFAKKLNRGDLFFDLKRNKQKRKASGISDMISMRPLGYRPITQNWSNILDAIIYIDQAKASNIIKR